MAVVVRGQHQISCRELKCPWREGVKPARPWAFQGRSAISLGQCRWRVGTARGVGARRCPSCGRAGLARVPLVGLAVSLSNAHSSWPTRSFDTPNQPLLPACRLPFFLPPHIPVYQLFNSNYTTTNQFPHIYLHGASRIRKHGIDRLRLLELDRNPPHNPESAWLDCTAPHYCESTRLTNARRRLLVAPSL